MISGSELVETWSSIYSNSAAIKSALGFAHLGGLLAGGGMAIAADRSTLAAHRFGADAMRREARSHQANSQVATIRRQRGSAVPNLAIFHALGL